MKVFIGGAGRKAGGSEGCGAAPVMKTPVEQNRFGQEPGLWVLLGLGRLEATQQRVSDGLAGFWSGLVERIRYQFGPHLCGNAEPVSVIGGAADSSPVAFDKKVVQAAGRRRISMLMRSHSCGSVGTGAESFRCAASDRCRTPGSGAVAGPVRVGFRQCHSGWVAGRCALPQAIDGNGSR